MKIRKPDLIIIGVQKAGTASLRYYLNQHPDIQMLMREGHFFENNPKPNMNEYYRWFGKMKAKIVGEKTPSYIFLSYIPKIIHKYLPNVKLIMMVRDPADRAYSEYNMLRLNGIEKNDFSYAIRNYPRSYLQRGMYAKQYKNLLRYFKEEQILLLKAENLKNNKLETLNKVYRFLDVEEFIPSDLSNRHIGASPSNKYITYICKIIENIRAKSMNNLNGAGKVLMYNLTSFFMLHLKRQNKKEGYEPMNLEDRRYIYKELVEDIGEFYKLTGIWTPIEDRVQNGDLKW